MVVVVVVVVVVLLAAIPIAGAVLQAIADLVVVLVARQDREQRGGVEAGAVLELLTKLIADLVQEIGRAHV